MKTHTLLFLALVTALIAQDKPKDPFVKDKKAAAEAAATADVPKNVVCLIETITLPQVDYVALLDSPKDREKLYERAVAAVKAGSAKLDGCHSITTKSGIRSVSEAVDELIYPTEWNGADRAGFQYPKAFEMRQLGDRIELEPTLEAGAGALDMTHAFSRIRFLGFRQYRADTTLSGVPVADFIEQQGPSGCRVIPGVPALVATLTSLQPGVITLVFATTQVVSVIAPAPPPQLGAGNIHMTARVISLDRMKGWELLKKHPLDGTACLAELKPLLAAKEAVLEHVSTISTKSGTRAVHDSGGLYPYGTEFDPPTEGKPAQPSDDPKKPATPAKEPALAGTKSFESRALGFRFEVEPTMNVARTTIDIITSFSNTLLKGALKDKNWSERYPDLPLFSNQKITTGYTQAFGSTTLIGTLNPPGDTGANEHKDESRLWLLFLEVSHE